jgi:glycosyltransferase involved in cell wall biosynthesis
MVEQAIKCLPELSVDVHAVVAIDAGAPDSVEAAERARRTAAETRVDKRVHCASVTRVAAIEDAIAQAELVIVTAETVAGPWHGLRPLRFGKPMLAPHLPLFQDVLLLGGGVRLVRPSIADHLAACVRAVLANPIGMAEMHDRGIAYAEANTYEAHARRLMELFEEALAA